MRATGRFDDQLLTGPVDVRRALQKVWVFDTEPVQGGLERSGVLAEVACDGQFGFGRTLRATAGIVDGAGGDPGGSQDVAGGPDGGGRLTSSSGCFGGRLGGFLAQPEQGVDMVRKGGSEGPGYV